jgi:L-malate glycosyltransferase
MTTRICYLGDASSPLLHRWLAHFADRGYDVHVLSVDRLPHPIPGVKQHLLTGNLPSVSRSRRRQLRYGTSLPAARRILRRLEPDLVHAHYAWGYGLLGALTSPAPLIVSVWGSDLTISAARSPAHRAVMRLILGRAHIVCATSRFLAEVASRYTSKRIVVTPFGVDCERFCPPTHKPRPSTPLTVGMVKKLAPGSGIAVLLDAHAQLARQMAEPPRLVVVGGADGTDWPARARQLGTADRVDFRGWIPPESLPSLLQRLDVYVAPSTSLEGFGVAVLEAQACGVPVVASRIGGLPEVVKEGASGLLVPPNDVHALADALALLMDDTSRRARMGLAARAFVRNQYEWNATAAIMEELYERVVSK